MWTISTFHDGAEDKVFTRGAVATGPEHISQGHIACVEGNFANIVFCLIEYCNIGIPESIDRLFRIADDEEISLLQFVNKWK